MNGAELQAVLNNPAISLAARRAAECELAALLGLDSVQKPDAGHADLSPTEESCLRSAHANTLAEVDHIALHKFCSEELRWNNSAFTLWEKWMSVSPVAEARCRDMANYMREYFWERYDGLLARLRDAITEKRDATLLRMEIREFFEDWASSTVLPASIKKVLTAVAGALVSPVTETKAAIK